MCPVVLHDGNVLLALLGEACRIETLPVARHVIRERVGRVLGHTHGRRGHNMWCVRHEARAGCRLVW